MAVTYEGMGTVLENTGGSAAVAWPAHQTDDIGICVMEASGGGAAISPPTDWDELADLRDVSTTAGSRVHVFAIRATSGSMTNPTVAAQQDHKVSAITIWRGVDTAVAVSALVVATGTKATPSSTATLPTITTPSADCCVVLICSRPNDDASTTHFGTPSNGNLTGISAGTECGTTQGNGGGFVVAYGFKATAGATGTTTMSKSASTTDTYTVIALPPAVTATDVNPVPTVVTVVSAEANIEGTAGVTPAGTRVTVVSAVGNVGATASVAPTGSVVVVVAAQANVGGTAGVTPAATVVTVVAAVGNVGGHTAVNPVGSVVVAVSAEANVGGTANIAPAPTVVTVVSAVANVSGDDTADIEPIGTRVTVVSAVASIAATANVGPRATTVTVVAATGGITATAGVTPRATITTVVAAVANVAGQANIAPAPTTVTVTSGTATITGTAAVGPSSTLVIVVAAIANIFGDPSDEPVGGVAVGGIIRLHTGTATVTRPGTAGGTTQPSASNGQSSQRHTATGTVSSP